MKNQFYHENLSRQVQIVGQMRGGHRRNILESDADASRLRKGLSLPSRRLVPCILAALTAGTVTLGALPCAYAAPIVCSAVTEDIDLSDDGVAGSNDGSHATITVGTEGGGTSPVLTNNGRRRGGDVSGLFYNGAVANTSRESPFTLQGGSAVIHSGTMRKVYGSNAEVKAVLNQYHEGDVYVQVTGGSVTITGGETSYVAGGYVRAGSSQGRSVPEGTVCGNVVRLQGGTHTNVYGGLIEGPGYESKCFAEGNTVYISGGTYRSGGLIAGGMATSKNTSKVCNNTIEITGAPGPLPRLIGGIARGGYSNILKDNALIVRDTKGITAVSVEDFQKFVFYVPAGLAAGEPMLTLTSATQDVKLEGAVVEAHLPGSVTAHDLTLLQTAAHIKTDAATKMTVYEGISGGMLTSTIYVDNTKQKLMVRRDGSFLFTGVDNAKSLAETMAGSAAFLGTGANLFTDAGLRSASTEAATTSGFAPFAALGGASLRHETGSHVEMKGMNLAVGFSRALQRGNDRLLFGPLVEYGRGNYDSYVNAVHGDGTVSYLGAGAFLRREQANGLFYEGSLRFGRTKMDYNADLPVGFSKLHTSYDTDANYIGAHLGIGQQVTAKNETEREMYLRYFYTRQDGASATLSTGDHYTFDAVDSHRLRTGVRWTMPRTGGALILGTSVQYEFGGDTSATYHRPGGLSYTSPSPSLKGFSGSLEVGWKAAVRENMTANVAVEGWMGKQRGVSLSAGVEWMF